MKSVEDIAQAYSEIMLKAKYDGLVEFDDSRHMAKCAFDLAEAMQKEGEDRKQKPKCNHAPIMGKAWEFTFFKCRNCNQRIETRTMEVNNETN